ncbi:MAG TPA: hypothetical protein VH300_02935 [Thermoleophilaceae bacterium]|jgi:hypothetical protein|nr:hypothetical protein [Thermoleophilaceae bacterium]
MRQAQARKVRDAYLDAPRRSERHLRVVEDAAIADPGTLRVADLNEPRVVEDLRVEAPAVEIPDWAEPFADPRWDDRLGSADYEERDGRRTVLVTGRPEGKALPRRDGIPGSTARMRRQTPTRARLAGRPDRVALWAVALGLLMAAMAGFTGNGHSHSSSHAPAEPNPAQFLSR